MIRVYGLPKSRSSRALWALEEAGVAYEFKAMDFKKGEQRETSFLQMNPAAKVPVLVDDDLQLTESGAIVNYVLSRYAPDLIPEEPVARAHYDRWCLFALTELEQGLWTIGKHKFALPSERRVAAMLEVGAWEYLRALELFSKGLGDKAYVLGEHFTGADILLGHTLVWGSAFVGPVEHANLADYLERLTQRPAYQRVVEVEAG